MRLPLAPLAGVALMLLWPPAGVVSADLAEVVAVERWEEAIPMLLAGRGDLLAGVNDAPLVLGLHQVN
jgi:hypothetical protein